MNKSYYFFENLTCTIFVSMLVLFSSCKKQPPVVLTLAVTNITHESAVSGGTVTDEGDGSVVARGVVWGINDPTLESNDGVVSEGSGGGFFTSEITGLSPYTDYIVRSFASSEYGTSYGNPQNFKTLSDFASIQTTTPYGITWNSCKTGGTISNDGGSEVTERGICYGPDIHPETDGTRVKSGNGTGSFTVTITDLEPGSTYYVRAYAINIKGEILGELLYFTLGKSLTDGIILYKPGLTYGSVTDIDGNTYKTVVIGSQTWMADNLRTTRYNNGKKIKTITDNLAWVGLSTPAYCWYNNNISFKSYIGALYNWFVIDSGNVCPNGWHVPTDEEWTTLGNYLGGNSIAGGAVKEEGTTHWDSPNAGATNSSGFTSLPSGYRSATDGTFNGMFNYEGWWSSTEYNELKPYYRNTSALNAELWRGNGQFKAMGRSIRCIKD